MVDLCLKRGDYMQKFKCKKCSKMVKLIGEPPEEQVCPHCGTIHEWMYDKGWKYGVKGYRTRKCLYCNKNIFIKEESGKTQEFKKVKCEHCGEYNLAHWIYSECELIPNGKVITECAWCHEDIAVDMVLCQDLVQVKMRFSSS